MWCSRTIQGGRAENARVMTAVRHSHILCTLQECRSYVRIFSLEHVSRARVYFLRFSSGPLFHRLTRTWSIRRDELYARIRTDRDLGGERLTPRSFLVQEPSLAELPYVYFILVFKEIDGFGTLLIWSTVSVGIGNLQFPIFRRTAPASG